MTGEPAPYRTWSANKPTPIARQGKEPMRHLLILTLPMLGISCGPAEIQISEAGACDALASLVERHADALLEDGGDASVTTGADLIAAYDAVCT